MLKHAETGAMAQRKQELRATVKHVDERLLAVIPVRADLSRFGQQIMRCIDEVEDYVREAAMGRPPRGDAVVLYHGLLFAESRVDIGIEVNERFDAKGPVVSGVTPAGRVATAIHHGAYDGLRRTNTLLRQWCADSGHELTGEAWELYHGLNADPAKRTTELFYLLK